MHVVNNFIKDFNNFKITVLYRYLISTGWQQTDIGHNYTFHRWGKYIHFNLFAIFPYECMYEILLLLFR